MAFHYRKLGFTGFGCWWLSESPTIKLPQKIGDGRWDDPVVSISAPHPNNPKLRSRTLRDYFRHVRVVEIHVQQETVGDSEEMFAREASWLYF